MPKSAEQLYEERLQRVQDAIALRKPDRVPIAPVIEVFPMYYSGITIKEAMYDYGKATEAWDTFFADFRPDLAWDPIFAYPGKVFEMLDLQWFRWPGHGVPDNRIYQFVEGEYMEADEYDELIFDPTQFVLTKYLPRIFSSLKGLSNLAPIRDSMWLGWFNVLPAFTSPEVQEALDNLKRGADELMEWFGHLISYQEKMKTEMGLPTAWGAFSFVPYDILGDTMRGTKGVMIDLHRQPENVLKATEKITPIAIEMGVKGAAATGRPFVWIWLHKGCKGFMSDEQFNRFYWPGMRDLIVGLIDEGLTPVVYGEGDYTPRLETIKDIPAGKAIYHFEGMDMVKAKEVLGDVVCISGNLPNRLLISGTPDEVRAYCKELIDTVGKGGGYIMDTGALIDEADPENLKAMFEFTKEYGVY